jgi:hypothetical protein
MAKYTHRMFDPQTNRIVVSRDVVFEETVKWDWSAAENEHISIEMEMGGGILILMEIWSMVLIVKLIMIIRLIRMVVRVVNNKLLQREEQL